MKSPCSNAFGSAASDDVVENAINAGSFTARANLRSGTLAKYATGNNTINMNRTKAP